MATRDDEVKELQLEVERLQEEANRYRKATEDCLQQIGWVVGYFAGANKPRLAGTLGANVNHIRRELLNRPDIAMPTSPE
jgi:hypothetical protein